MTRPASNTIRWNETESELRHADDDAAAAIFAMLTSSCSEPDLTCDAEGNPLSTAAYEGRVMWF